MTESSGLRRLSKLALERRRKGLFELLPPAAETLRGTALGAREGLGEQDPVAWRPPASGGLGKALRLPAPVAGDLSRDGAFSRDLLPGSHWIQWAPRRGADAWIDITSARARPRCSSFIRCAARRNSGWWRLCRRPIGNHPKRSPRRPAPQPTPHLHSFAEYLHKVFHFRDYLPRLTDARQDPEIPPQG